MKINIFVPCFIDQLFPQTAINMVKILKQFKCDVHYNPSQTCCGQAAYNAGFGKEAKMVAEKFLQDFDEKTYIVAPSASCVTFVRNYYQNVLKENSEAQKKAKKIGAKIYEFSDFLVNILKIKHLKAQFQATATYHDSCSALRECKIKSAPRYLLQQVKGLKLEESPNCEVCCGFGGTFSVQYPPLSAAMAHEKIEQIQKHTTAEYIVSTDWSCLMHLDAYIQKNNLPLKTIHLIDVLAMPKKQ